MTDTRTRLLEAAWQAVLADGVGSLTLREVAERADVSRQAVYLHFQNRAGLLTAMARHQDVASGFADRVALTTTLEPRAAFDALLRAWFDYLPEILPAARALEAAAITGDEGAVAFDDRMRDWHQVIRASVRRLATVGVLLPGWSADAAADWVWSRVHPSTWERLVTERCWSRRRFEQRTLASLHSDLFGA
jgi:AcrR family transcriptional regulator